MKYGHRQDAEGYAAALNAFDRWLGTVLPLLRDDDVLIVTADHGCDPSDHSTDHTREYVPFLMYGKDIPSDNLGTVLGFDYVAKTVRQLLLAK
jgi:phosphopentomutase